MNALSHTHMLPVCKKYLLAESTSRRARADAMERIAKIMSYLITRNNRYVRRELRKRGMKLGGLNVC